MRLVAEAVLVDGTPRSIYDVLEEPRLARLLSDARRLMGLESAAARALQQRKPRW